MPCRIALTAAVLAGSLLADIVTAEPRFTPVPVPDHRYTGGWDHFVGGGIAGFDCSGDGLPELFAAGGDSPAMLLRNGSTRDTVRFADDTPPELALRGLTGAYPLDVDGDGHMDLALLSTGANRLMRGLGDCRFAAFDTPIDTAAPRWTTAFSATWEPGQSLPTLAFGNYVDRSDPDGPFGTCDAHRLWRPQGDSYGPPLDLTPGYCTLSMLFSDWNRDGRADLRISNDRHYYVSDGHEQLWHMTTPPRPYSETEGWRPHKLWGMGIASRDLTGDGRPEVFLTSMGDQRLQQLRDGASGPTYDDAPFARGTTAHRPYTGGDGRPSTGWHVAFGDIQNDGRDDVFIAKGNVDQMPGLAHDDPNNLLIQTPDGTFAEAGERAGIASLHRARGAALMDLNGDGRLDLAVVNRRAPLEVWQNLTADPGHWLSVSLHQPGGNRNAVGAWIELDDGTRIQTREITVGGGHAGGVAGPAHFGLGTTRQARLRVIWPDGEVGDWQSTPVDRKITIRRSGVSGFR
ncbi:MAG: CRTAC1 family protein [Marinibacterium sp.]|nr:CRTAC1 family protein [Marinibacterium sp.]